MLANFLIVKFLYNGKRIKNEGFLLDVFIVLGWPLIKIVPTDSIIHSSSVYQILNTV